MRHRLLAGVAAAGLGVLLVAPGADAAPADWNGTRITTQTVQNTASFSIDAEIHRRYNRSYQQLNVLTSFATPAGLPPGCPGATETPLTTSMLEDNPNSPDVHFTTAPVTVTCNGVYGYRVNMTLTSSLGAPDTGPTLTGQITVAVPPAPVEGIEGTYSEGAVLLTWSAGQQDPDFEGFQVSRRDGEEWTTLADGLRANEFADTTPPAAGGEVRYRIRARRSSPDGTLYSTGGTRSVTVPSTTTTSAPGGGTDGGTTAGTDGGTTPGTDGGTTGGTDGGGTTGTGGTGGSGGTGRTGRTFSPLPRGRVGVGIDVPRIGTPSSSNYEDLLNDAGYDPELDYGEDGLASEDEGYSVFSYENTAGRGMAVPVATGLVLAAWAFHLRFLARAAKPAKVARPPRHRPSY